MRPVRIITTVVFAAALAAAGCVSRTADQTAAPASPAPSSVTTTTSTAASTTRSTPASTTTVAVPAKATCAVAPTAGLAGSRVTLTCRRFAPSEPVAITFGATVLATTKATTSGAATASFAVPSGFAGSHYPGRKDTFQAKGRQSGKAAAATFTVTG
jgi:hypothetical protein